MFERSRPRKIRQVSAVRENLSTLFPANLSAKVSLLFVRYCRPTRTPKVPIRIPKPRRIVADSTDIEAITAHAKGSSITCDYTARPGPDNARIPVLGGNPFRLTPLSPYRPGAPPRPAFYALPSATLPAARPGRGEDITGGAGCQRLVGGARRR